MKKHLILFLMFFYISVSAQDKIKLEGCFKDTSDSLGLVTAIVVIVPQDSSMQNIRSITDNNGHFELFLPRGVYNLSVRYMGGEYKIGRGPISVDNLDINLEDMYINLQSMQINEVIVTARKPFVRYDFGKTLIDLSANPATSKGSVADGILQIPGINLSPQGQISLYGIYSIAVYIDGRNTNMKPEQLNNYLSSMSVDDLEIVELITNPGPQYGKNTQAVLNIKTKRRANDGVNGFISATGEYFNTLSGRVSGRININKGISKNYLSYSFSDYRKNIETGIELKNNNSASENQGFVLTEQEKLKPQQTQWINLGSDLAFDAKNTLGAKISLGNIKNNFENNSILENIARTFNSQSLIKTKYNALLGNLFYAYSDSKYNWINNLDYTGNTLGRNNTHDLNYNQSIDEKNHFYRLSSDLNVVFSPKISTAIGFSLESSDLNSKSTTQQISSTYDYRELNSAAYVMMNYKANGYYISAGLRLNREQSNGTFEQYRHKIDTSVVIFQPNITISRDFSSRHQLKIAYNRNYSRPGFRDIIPYESYTGTYIKRIGNPNLQISKEDIVSFSYTYLRAAMLEISYNHTSQPIVEVVSEKPTQLTLYKANLEKSEYLRLLIAVPIPYTKNWIGTTYFAAQKQFDRGIVNNSTYTKNSTVLYFQHKESISLTSGWYFDAQVTYYSPLMFGIYNMDKQWWVSSTVSKTIQNVKLSFLANDIFNTNRAKGEFISTFSTMNFEKNWNYPDIRFTVTYNFGNKKLKSYKTRNAQIKATQRLNTNPDQGISSSK